MSLKRNFNLIIGKRIINLFAKICNRIINILYKVTLAILELLRNHKIRKTYE